MSLTTAVSPHSVSVSVERLLAALERRGIEVFATIDHGAGARQARLELSEEVVVIFGDPKVGTLLMQDDGEVGYELPLRMLIREDGGRTVLAYRPPSALADEYALGERLAVLGRIETLLEQLLMEIASP